MNIDEILKRKPTDEELEKAAKEAQNLNKIIDDRLMKLLIELSEAGESPMLASGVLHSKALEFLGHGFKKMGTSREDAIKILNKLIINRVDRIYEES